MPKRKNAGARGPDLVGRAASIGLEARSRFRDLAGFLSEPKGRIRPSHMTETNLGAIVEASATLDHGGALASPLRRAGSHERRADQEAELELAFHEGAAWRQQADASGPPWRCVCHLEIRYAGGSGVGTGWFASPATVVTAGHNLLHPNFGWAERVTVRPGLNMGAVGLLEGAHAIEQRVHKRWKSSNATSLAHDIGCVKLADGALGSFLGHFGLRVLTDEELALGGLLIHCAGYPSTKRTGSMWVDAGRIAEFDDQFIYHRLDTMTGVSGAPVFASFPDGQRLVVGGHSHGVSDGAANAAVRITDEIFDLVQEWAD